MYPAEFDYLRAGSVAEATRLLREHEGAKLLAGGHSLIPLLKLRLARPSALIDIGRIAELKGITEQDGVIRIGALTTHSEIASSDVLRARCPVLAEAAAGIGDPQVRNRGTVGGNVAHADPVSDLPPVLTALQARFIVARARGRHTVGSEQFFQGPMTTALTEHDVLTFIEVPRPSAGQGQAYVKYLHPASRYAVIGAAAIVTISRGSCTAASVVLGGLVTRPTRATSVEAALVGRRLTPEVISAAAGNVLADLGDDLLGDIYASSEYRRVMASLYVGRALTAAAQRATG